MLLGTLCLIAGLVAVPRFEPTRNGTFLTDAVLLRNFDSMKTDLEEMSALGRKLSTSSEFHEQRTLQDRSLVLSSKLSILYEFFDSQNYHFFSVVGRTNPPGSYKGYAYCPGSVSYKIVESLDDTNNLVQPGFTLRHIKGDWYLFIVTFRHGLE